MKPSEYIDELNGLIGAGRDEDALDLAARFGAEVTPRLTDEQFFRVCSMLEGAQLAIDATAMDDAVMQDRVVSGGADT
jgi:hypothetical protein